RERLGRLDLAHRHPQRFPVRRRLRLRERGVPRRGGPPAWAPGPGALLLAARHRSRGGHWCARWWHVRRIVGQLDVRLRPSDWYRAAAGGDLDRRGDRRAGHALAALVSRRWSAGDGRYRRGDRGVGVGTSPIPL